MPGAWAPSTSVSIPRSAKAGTNRSTGRTSAVGLVTWLMTASRVRRARGREDPLHDVVGGGARERQADQDHARSVPLGDVAQDVDDGVVLVIGRENLVALGRTTASGRRR